MPHPPYSPDFTPSNFFLFIQDKKVLKGKHCVNVEEVKQTKKRQKHKKPSKLMSLKTVLSSGKNVSIEVVHRTESVLKVTEV